MYQQETMINRPLLNKQLAVRVQDARTNLYSDPDQLPGNSPLLGIVGVGKGPQKISYKEVMNRAHRKEIEKLTELAVTNINKAEETGKKIGEKGKDDERNRNHFG